MAFNPKEIEKRHVLLAVEKIEREKIKLKTSTMYDVIINGKNYPPKDVMRFAREAYDGSNFWNYTGGRETNKHLERMGFTIVKKLSKSLDKAILKALSSNGIVQKALTSKDYYFRHASNVKEQIDNFSIEKEEALSIKKDYFNDTVQFEQYVETLSGKKKEFALLIGELISYLDLHASGKRLWNQYADKRVVARSGVRQPHWINHIILSKFNPEHQSPPNIQKSLDYISNPTINHTVLAENHRQNIYSNILNKEYSPSEFNHDLSEYFEKFDINPINPANRTYIIGALLYDKDVKKLWLNPETADSDINLKEQSTNKSIVMPLNQILYGPPGTGKTYNTINKAIKIANPTFNLEQERRIIKEEFDRLQVEGRIVFTTFHQSMSYEDFVEGIKPISPEEDSEETQVTYEVQSGIFKNICNQARVVKGKKVDIDFTKVNFHKMSLGGKNRPDIHEWCISNNKLALGYGGEYDLSEFKAIKNWVQFRELFKQKYPELVAGTRFHIQTAYAFIHMNPDDIVVISKGNHIIDAIGRIKGEYNYDNSNSIDYFHFRDVEWLATDMGASPEKFVKKNISQVTIYTFNNSDMKLDAYRELTGNESEDEKNYVLIIDEINRGNVSQIFGELITLIEADKRQGKAEAIELILPYSKKKFGVPPNLYIIGTMNTADRSVEALDAALRRRFHFKEMPPNSSLLDDLGKKILFNVYKRHQNNDWDDSTWLNVEKDLVQLISNIDTYEKTKYKLDDKFWKNNWNEEKIDEYLKEANIEFIDFTRLLKCINQRIRVLLDKDHMIGHSYFLGLVNSDYPFHALKKVFSDKIIPLLQEYFFGDYSKISLVLGRGFCDIDDDLSNCDFAPATANISDSYNEREVFCIKKIESDNEFLEALKQVGFTKKNIEANV